MAAGILASCNDKMEVGEAYLNGSSKTPIAVQTNLSAAPRTRAFDKTFESGDQLLAYIEAGVTTSGTFSSEDNPFKGLKTFVLTANANNTDGDNHADLYGYTVLPDGVHITETEDVGLQKLYWDDYSSTSNDLRASGAGIRLKYGYCYNGGTPSTDLVETTGVLGWTVKDNQSAANGVDMKKSDLLYATTQAPVSYVHGDAQTSKHGVLVLPYAHAMSKITINVTTGEGYDASKENFASSVLTLKKMQTKVSVDAPNDTIKASSDNDAINDVITYISNKENTTATYQAIVAPCTNLSIGNVLASITKIDGNDYDIPITSDIIEHWKTGSHLWSDAEVINNGLAQAKPLTRANANIDAGTGYKTKPGVHYILDVTVNKQKITIRATIADWDEVKATGEGKIQFAGDVTEKGTIADELKAKGFDVYKSSNNASFPEVSTTVKNVSNVWTYSPAIYWQNKDDNAYFRALSPAGTTAGNISQGVDVLWGTSGDAAIKPRTGDVKLDFVHAMSKITMQLETSTGASQVKTEGASISISNLSTSGSINLVDGAITPTTAIEAGITSAAAPIKDYAVIPQELSDASIITITLADGTTYKLNLTDCKDADGNAVTEWLPGKHYTYTIHLEKEKITFRALVKDWEGATGSGNATLEWD